MKSHRFPYVTVLNNSKTRATVLKMICSFIIFVCARVDLFDVKMLCLLRFAVGGVDGFFLFVSSSAQEEGVGSSGCRLRCSNVFHFAEL